LQVYTDYEREHNERVRRNKEIMEEMEDAVMWRAL
jgi:hypothetical protein